MQGPAEIYTAGYGGVTWKIATAYRAIVEERIIRYLPSAPVNARLIKKNMAREVYCVPLAADCAILKIYKVRKLEEKLKYSVLPSKGAAEWKMMRTLSTKGIAVPEPIALGEDRRWGGITYLVLKEIPGARSLHQCLQDRENFSDKNADELLELTGAFTAQIHRAKIRHKDFHSGNILVRREGPRFHLFLIDLHTAKIGWFLPRSRKIENLAKMGTAFSPSRLMTFVGSYCREIGFPADHLSDEVSRKIDKLRLRTIASRSRRCIKESSRFSTIKSRHSDIYVRRDYREVLDLWTRREICADGKAVEMSTTIGGRDMRIFIRHYAYNRLERLKNLFVRSKAKKEWMAGHRRLLLGFSTPEPIALIEEKSWGTVVRSYMVLNSANGTGR